MRRLAERAVAALLVLSALAGLAARADTVTEMPAPLGGTQMLVIRSATDLDVIQPLLADFQRIAPDLGIRYVETLTNDLFARSRRECQEKRSDADMLITSSVDHLVVLSNEGCALSHRSPESGSGPAWTRWRDEVFGFTFEPAVIVYNRTIVPADDVPRTRVELINLLREHPARFVGRIGAYNVAQSGIGYLFGAFDARDALIYGRLIEGFGRMRLVTRCCTGDLINEIADGRLYIGYNLLGSYAVAARRKGAQIGIVIPRDYVLALSRAALIPAAAANPGAARRFLDYLLSARGQRVMRESAFYFDFSGQLPADVDGAPGQILPGTIRPIVIGPGLLPVQDRAKRQRFLNEWHRSIGDDIP